MIVAKPSTHFSNDPKHRWHRGFKTAWIWYKLSPKASFHAIIKKRILNTVNAYNFRSLYYFKYVESSEIRERMKVSAVMQNALRIVKEWCEENLSVNASKAEMILLTKQRKMRLVKQVKYLGITIDDKLTWKPQVDTKSDPSFLQWRRAFWKTWGLSSY